MDLGLKGLKAVVTGGSRGIGRAIVDGLAAEGCAVALCARGAEGVDATVQAIRAAGGEAIGEAVDVSDGEALQAWVNSAGEALAGIDILVCNASALAAKNGDAAWLAGFETDIMGTVRAVDTALPWLKSSRSGAIVNIASTAALEIYAGLRPYNSIKAALVNYTAGLSVDLGGQPPDQHLLELHSSSPSSLTMRTRAGVADSRGVTSKSNFVMAAARADTE